jgi:heavy metal sensor kinase
MLRKLPKKTGGGANDRREGLSHNTESGVRKPSGTGLLACRRLFQQPLRSRWPRGNPRSMPVGNSGSAAAGAPSGPGRYKLLKSFRLRITAWYLAFFSALFLLFSISLYSVLSTALTNRADDALTADSKTAAALFADELEEAHGDAARAAPEVISEMHPPGGIVVAIFEGQELLAASAPEQQRELVSDAREFTGGETDSVLPLPSAGMHGARAAAHRLTAQGREFLLLAVEPMDSIAAELAIVRRVIAIALPLLLAIAGIGGYALATRSLAPLGWMADQARKISDRTLHTRLEIGNAAEELTVLAASFNELLSRLDQSFESMRRFVADASHELRTPLAVIRGEADVALEKDRSPADYRESLAVIQDESRRLSRLVEDLLNLARADAGHVKLRMGEFYLNDLMAECCRSAQSLASAREIDLECGGCADDVSFRGDEELLRRLVLNLLDNAIRYTPRGGKVTAAIEARGDELRLRVSDTGIGISPEAVPHVFERFYRADKARSRNEGGFGLGLSIVKWIAESHHGAVELTSNPGAGSTFTVLLHR